MKYRWLLPPPGPCAATRGLAETLGVSPLLAQCLANRGLTEPATAHRFLKPRLRNLADPDLVPNLRTAVLRLVQARAQGEPLVIFGDYDVDGVTATALLLETLGALGLKVSAYLPHRLDEGYGLSQDGVLNCLEKHPVRLLLAVDCGSTANDIIAHLTAQNVDVIVLDHHQVSNPPPKPLALVNPQLDPPGSQSGHELSAVGLAFKLAHGLVRKGRELDWPEAHAFDLRPRLDLVTLGTLADLVPVTGENRAMICAGLDRLNPCRRPGLIALRDVAQIPGPIGPYEVAFQLAPRLNAAGRLESAAQALDLLLASDPAAALELARTLDSQNRERQRIEHGIADEAIRAVRAHFDAALDYVIVEGQLLWHVGVVGIVASRLLQTFYRPSIVLGGDGHEWRGSGRSVEGFDLAAALHQCSDLLVRHGGHPMAAGLTVRPENVPALRQRLNHIAHQILAPDRLVPPLRLDAVVPLRDLTLELVHELRQLEPSGHSNPPVQIALPGLTLRRPPQRIGREQQHLKFQVTDGHTTCDAVWWGAADKPWPEGAFDLAGVPQVNTYADRTSLQLKVLDWRPAT